jgi:hypothetical protein
MHCFNLNGLAGMSARIQSLTRDLAIRADKAEAGTFRPRGLDTGFGISFLVSYQFN